MSGVSVDADVVMELDFSPVLPCEGEWHPEGKGGHDPEAPGAFLIVTPCCGPSIVQCAGRTADLRSGTTISCSRCKADHPVSEYGFIPVDGDGL